jgi:hypothetical protein
MGSLGGLEKQGPVLLPYPIASEFKLGNFLQGNAEGSLGLGALITILLIFAFAFYPRKRREPGARRIHSIVESAFKRRDVPEAE